MSLNFPKLTLVFLSVLSLGLDWTTETSAESETKLEHQAIPVRLEQTAAGWQLIREGQPYRIKGAGGEASLGRLRQSGGNSVRTWGIGETTLEKLDEAHRQGLTVALGIWLEHERHGFRYSDPQQVEEQFQLVIQGVQKFKDHPAVLVWGIGNEMEGDGQNPLIWQHIEKLAAAIKKIDPHHPTMTVIAEMGGGKIASLHQFCPSIDIIGINSYGGATTVPIRYRELGGTKPYIVTEFGPAGPWEVAKNANGGVIEKTSTEKVIEYRNAYQAFENDTQLCLGSYAFLWGSKQEATATWFGLFLPNGNRTAAVDELQLLWSGKPVDNQCPRIESWRLDGPAEVLPGSIVHLKLSVVDPENDPLNVKWVLMGEADSYETGGDFQETPPSYSENVIVGDLEKGLIKMPEKLGLYRVYVFVDDGQGGAATANYPIRVRQDRVQAGIRVELPLVIYDEPNPQPQAAGFVPSGWMGNTAAIEMNEASTVQPKFGKHCLEVQYRDTGDWGGVIWQHPANNWGDSPGGLDLRAARKLSFWARGANGKEKVKFGFGVLGAEKNFPDSGSVEREVELTTSWQEFVIDLEGVDLSSIKTGFFWSAAGQIRPLTFFLDRIAYD